MQLSHAACSSLLKSLYALHSSLLGQPIGWAHRGKLASLHIGMRISA
jgi:hypothetical protein